MLSASSRRVFSSVTSRSVGWKRPSVHVIPSNPSLRSTASSRRVFGPVTTRSVRCKSSSAHVVPGNPSPQSLLWPGVFTIGFAGGCFGMVSVSLYHERQGHQKHMVESAPSWARDLWERMHSTNSSLPLFGPLIAANVGVWTCWKAFPDLAIMKRYFLHTPGQGRALPMVLCTFSHMGVLHLLGNMVGLWTFGSAVSREIGLGHTAAVYLSSGVAAQFFSACFAVLSKRPIIPSIGASGGVLTLASIWACMYPESQIYLLLFPFVTFAAKKGLGGLVLCDFAGLVRGWQVIDHAAHLGGVGLGVGFVHLEGYKYVNAYCWQVYWGGTITFCKKQS